MYKRKPGMMPRNSIELNAFLKNRQWSAWLFTPYLLFTLALLSVALLIGFVLGLLSLTYDAILIGAIVMIIIIILRLDEIAVFLVFVVSLYIDWYLGKHIVGQTIVLLLLFTFFLLRSPRHPWAEPHSLFLWFLYLVLALTPAIRGAIIPYDTFYYYPNIIFGALTLFWLGTILAHDTTRVWRLFQLLAIFGALIAIHTCIQGLFGNFLFGSSRFDEFLSQVSGYQIAPGANLHRIGSFFVDPNWNGTFLAMMFCLSFGLFIASHSLFWKLLNLVEALLMAPALLFTYSGGAWLAAVAGVVALVVFSGRPLYRVQIPCMAFIAALLLIALFPLQVNTLLQHATGVHEVSLRVGAWQTALRVIQAFPLNGVGLGFTAYQLRAEPYRVPAQYLPLAHPHESYLEIAAMAGIPLLLIFLSLLLTYFWQATRNWMRIGAKHRSLLGAGMAAVIVLSVNSATINGWTLPPLAALGWFILGIVSSPLLIRGKPTPPMRQNDG